MNRRRGSETTRGRGIIPFCVAILLVLGAVGAALGLKRQERDVLRDELTEARRNADELKRVREENERLRQRQPTTADLERLRSDHAALVRLRTELETLRKE